MNRDYFYLTHILECVERVERFTTAGKDAFFADEKTQDAVLRNLELIGASVKRLSDDIKSAHPQLPWQRVAGFRDVLAHDYLGLDMSLIWNIVEADMPDLKRVVAEARSELRE